MRLLRGVVVAGLVLALGAPAASAQVAADTPSVSLRPTGSSGAQPNDGQWFVAEAEPGDEVRLDITITNPATVPQRVEVYPADLRIAGDGTASIGSKRSGVGAWGGFDTSSLLIPARSERRATFSVTVPPGVEPGDHLGAIVAEARPEGNGSVRVVKRVANRFYVTVPGDARPAFEVVDVELTPERWALPRWATVTVTLRNTGAVRVRPTVIVGGAKAAGSELLMSDSVERYVVRKRLPVWGGPVDFDVTVRSRVGDEEGPAATEASTFLFPLLLVLVLVLLVLGVLSARRLPRRRDRFEELAAELRRLEQELAGREQLVEVSARTGSSPAP